MKIKSILVFFLICSVLPGCSKSNDCFIADTTEEIKTIRIEDSNYFLYLRVSGFNEKEYFYELYNKRPEFDDCGKSTITPVSDIHVDTTVGSLSKLVIENERLDLVYSNESFNVLNLNNISIEVSKGRGAGIK